MRRTGRNLVTIAAVAEVRSQVYSNVLQRFPGDLLGLDLEIALDVDTSDSGGLLARLQPARQEVAYRRVMLLDRRTKSAQLRQVLAVTLTNCGQRIIVPCTNKSPTGN